VSAEQIDATLERAVYGWPDAPHIDELRAAQQAVSELAGLVHELESNQDSRDA